MSSNDSKTWNWLTPKVIGPWAFIVLMVVAALTGNWPTDDNGQPMKFNKWQGFHADPALPANTPKPSLGEHDPLFEKRVAQYPVLIEAKHAAIAEDYEKAIELFTKAIEIFPEDPEAYFCRGMALVELEEFPKAATDFEAAVRLKPSFAHSQVALCMILMTMGDFERAGIELEIAEKMELEPALDEAVRDLKIDLQDLTSEQ